MNTQLQAARTSAQNRRATQDEIDRASIALHSLDGESMAKLIETEHGMDSIDDGERIALVINDFSAVPDTARVLLVPPGVHDVPVELLASGQLQYIVGLAWNQADYPVLRLHGESETMQNPDTLEETEVCTPVCAPCVIGVILDAPQPTVLQVILANKQFSDKFFNVKWGGNVDAFNIFDQVLCNGWDWAINAYGSSMCRGRNVLEKGLDAVHEGILNTVDSIFLPLMKWGEKIDRAMGWE